MMSPRPMNLIYFYAYVCVCKRTLIGCNTLHEVQIKVTVCSSAVFKEQDHNHYLKQMWFIILVVFFQYWS